MARWAEVTGDARPRRRADGLPEDTAKANLRSEALANSLRTWQR